jgi:ubiquinone/menaquinone biosynthesis C-methylase UbiE
MLDLLSKHVRLSLSVSLERDLSLAKLIPTNGVCGSALALPFGSNIFDIVICSATRKHIKDSLALIEEIARVLKPGGRVIVIDPHPLLLRLGRWLGKFDSRYLHHMSSAAEISTEFRHAGLVACSAQTHAFVCCVGKKPSNSI